MISRRKKDPVQHEVGSLNRYKQTKLPFRVLKRESKKEYEFCLNQEAGVDWREIKENEVKGKFIFQFKFEVLGQLVNLTCHERWSEFYKVDPIEKLEENDDEDETWKSILKSHLQKAVRRMKDQEAIGTVLKLLDEEDDLVLLLRRLPIIMIEDTYLGKEIGPLIWLMIFYSQRENQGKKLPNFWREWLIAFVWNLCQGTAWKDEEWDSAEEFDLVKEKERIDGLENEEERAVIYALQLRKMYGGMLCDAAMIDGVCANWLRRFEEQDELELRRFNRQWKSLEELRAEGYDEVGCYLRKGNFILAGIDFHCCPWIIKDLQQIYPVEEEKLKSVIWFCSSSLNYRVESVEIDEELLEIWGKIKGRFEELSKRVLKSYLKESEGLF